MKRVGFSGFLAGLALLTASCGGSDGPEVIDLVVKDSKYSLSTITVKKDQQVTLRFKNADVVQHDIQVDDLKVEKMSNAGQHDHSAKPGQLHFHVDAGTTGEMTFKVPTTGTFEFYCTVEGHREAGMRGTLTVE